MNLNVKDICNYIIQKHKKTILISGNGGSGKSTLAKLLKDELQKSNQTVAIISTDDFLLDKNYRKNTFNSYTGKDGKTKTGYMASTFPESYDFISLQNAITTREEDIVIIEGIGSAFIVNDFDNAYKIFLQADKETEYKRRALRARSEADLSKERIEMRYEQFELFVLPLANKFDLRLVSQEDYSYKNNNQINID